ncbi:MAG TPA: hypothetical protein VHF00_03885 [Acidimicrobiales bacterium]|nr:hypothetical protein [Acidimicrobiales bacterium]
MDVASTKVHTRQGRERTLDDLTTLFDLCLVAIDVRRRSLRARLARKLAGAHPVLPRPGDPPPFPARPLGAGARAARG